MHVRVTAAELQSFLASSERQQRRYAFAVHFKACHVIEKACDRKTDAARKLLDQIVRRVDLLQLRPNRSQKLSRQSLLKTVESVSGDQIHVVPVVF